MKDVLGSLKGVTCTGYVNNGTVCHCMLNEKNEVKTCCGVLVPWYGEMNERRKNINSISFYKNGAVKRIALERQTLVDTPLGVKPAELVTFYRSGALKRFFPLNGQISGFWPEQDEEGLLETLSLMLPFGELRTKIISCCFYESGAIKSITLWPTRTIQVDTGFGSITVRHGISFYESGAIRSIEPARVTAVPTPIGMLNTYDITAVGIHADSNSLVFDEKGDVTGLTAPGTVFKVTCDDEPAATIAPVLAVDPLDDESMELPVRVSFSRDSVVFAVNGKQRVFDLHKAQFSIESKQHTTPQCGGNCAQCQMCLS